MANVAPTPPPSGYKVTSQIDQTGPDPTTGRYVPGRLITFITGNGTTGSVFVPLSLYSVANVQAMIANQAAVVDGVDALNTGI